MVINNHQFLLIQICTMDNIYLHLLQLSYHIIQNSLAIYQQFNINENFKYFENLDLIYN